MKQDNNDNPTEIEQEEDFEALLNRSMSEPVQFDPGEKLEAVITQITKEWVFIDIGGKTDGHILVSEFLDDDGNVTVKEGDRVQAYFLSSRNAEMRFTTRLTAETTENEHLEQAYHSGIPVEGLVEQEIKGGFQVKIAGDTRAFCPYSQMALHKIEDAGPYLGRRLTFKIVEYAKKGLNIVVSHRAVLEEERQKQKDALRASLKVGMTVSGSVTSVRKFGAFVDIGGLEGLIPISEISYGRVENIESVLSVGQQVDVAIKKLDWEKDKFSFSLKDVLADPWENIGRRYPEGSVHQGKVTRLAPFGAFVTLEPGVDGLVHISELGKEKRINHPREVLEQNQTVEVRIAKVDEETKRLSLEMASDERDSAMEYYKKHMAPGSAKSSGSLGTLGDLMRAKMEKKS